MTVRNQVVQNVTEQVGDFLTVTQTKKVANILDDELQNYDIVELKAGAIDGNSMNLLTMFLDAKRIEGRSEKTIARYQYILERAFKDIGVPIEKITVHHLRGYLMQEKKRGLSDGSLEGVRCTLSSCFSWLNKEGLIPKNPCANIGVIKCQKKIRLPYSAVDIEKLKDSCKTQRDRALISFLLSTGARISEVCALNISDIDFHSMHCKVLGKGNKERTVYINEVTAMELKKYIETRTDIHEALFIGKGSDRMTDQGVRAMLNEVGKAAGVPNVHPHRFRRTLATNLIGRGMPIQEVAFILGHENINTTLKYVHITEQSVESSYRRCA